ncbi:MAG: alpha-N-arabinofuranosidase, partial [Bacteroidales bacterium]|nr:alpha-N-arabinofuranosidase [Bacteroidales bacterium]
LKNHFAIMDAYDPEKKVALLLDEWGTWFDAEPGTIPGHLYQQNTMRDAMVAAMCLNVFNGMTDRLKMANIAQVVNVLQAMILTKGEKMLLTPTYHVFRMYNVHQNAQFVPTDYSTGEIVSQSGRICKDLTVSSSKDNSGAVHVSIANPSLDKSKSLEISFDALNAKSVSAEILKAAAISDYNDFDQAPKVSPAAFKDFRTSGKTIKLTIPAASVIVLEVK